MIGSPNGSAPKKKAEHEQKLTKKTSASRSGAQLRGSGDKSKSRGKPRAKTSRSGGVRTAKKIAPLQTFDLRENELIYRSLIDRAQDAIFVISRADRILYVNATAGRLFKVSPADLIGKARNELFPPEFAERQKRALKHVFETGETYASEAKFPYPSGEMWTSTVLSPIQDADGDITAVLGITRDIDKVKQAEQALQRSETNHRSVVENSVQGISIYQGGHLVYVNPAICEILGYSADELASFSMEQLVDMVHPDDRAAAITREAARSRGEKAPNRVENRIVRKDGSVRWIESYLTQIDYGGQPARLSSTIDITERKLAEQSLRANQERFRALIEKSTDGIALLDANGIAMYESPSAKTIFGVPAEELIGKNMFNLLHPDDLEPSMALFATLLQEPGNSVSGEFRLRHADGTWRWVESTGTNLLHDPSVQAIVVNYRDVTESRQAERALREREEHFRSHYQNATLGIYRTTPDGRILLANPALVELMGYESFEALLNLDLEKDLYGPDYPRGQIRERLEKQGEMRGMEGVWKRKDGSRVHVRESARAIRDAHGRILYYEGTVEDVTDRKLAELAVQHSERQLQTLISNLPGMAYRCRNDADWTMEFASDGCQALTGYAAEDLVGNKVIAFDQIIHAEDRRRTRNEIEAAVRKGEPYEITYRILRPNQEERWIWDKGRLVEQSDLGFDFMEGFMTDITELVNRQRALETLHAGGLTLGKSLDPHEIGQSIIRVLEERLDWHHAAVRVRADGTDEIELLAFSEPHAHPSVHDQKKETARSRISRLGEGMSGWVIAHGETIRSSNLAEDPRYVAVFQDMRSGLYVPITSAGRTIGCISVEDDRPEAFTAEDERVLTTLASQAAVALENARLFEAERLRRQDAETLQQAAASLASSLDAEKLIDELLEGLAKVISFDSVTVFIQEGENVRAMAGKGLVSPEIIIGHVFPTDAIFERIANSRRPVIIPDVQDDPSFADWGSQQHVRGWMGVPLIAAGKAIGYLTLDSVRPNAYSNADIEMAMAFASHAAAAIENARMFEETRQRADEFAILYETTRGLASPQDSHQALQTVVEQATQLMRAPVGGIYLFDAARNELEVVVNVGFPSSLGTRLAVGEGAAGHVAQTREPFILDDYQTWEGRSHKYDGVPLHAVLEVPMIYHGDLVGVLTVNEIGDSRRKFTEADARLLSLFATAAAGTVYSARLFEQLQQRLQQLSALHSIDMVISASTDLRVNLKVILETALRQLKADAVSVLLLNPVTLNLEYAAGEGFETLEISKSLIRLGEGSIGRIALSKEMLVLPNLAIAGQDFPRQKMIEMERFASYIGLPLIAKGQMRGILEVFHRTPFEMNDDWLSFMNLLSGQTAIAVDNSLLFENLERLNAELMLAYDATIEGWSQALEMRGSEAPGHSRRVLDWTMNLMHEMGVRERGMQHVRRGALLHDIGKMGIPDEILHKPGSLTPGEWEIMRRHPQYAYDLLSPIAYLRAALEIPYSHHEKWDGSGYPRGLKGEDIPLAARVFAVVDVYDALTSDKPYRAAWSHQKALEHIQAQSGQHFDPQIVAAFLQMIRLEKQKF